MEESESRQAIKWFVPLSLGAWTARRRALGQDKDVVSLGCTGTMPEISHVERAEAEAVCGRSLIRLGSAAWPEGTPSLMPAWKEAWKVNECYCWLAKGK